MLKMNKLVGLAFTYVDDASSDAEFITAGRIGKKMIQKELGCDLWVASRILSILGNKESWLPHVDKMPDTLPKNASEVLANALTEMGIRFITRDYGLGGISFNKVK